MRAKYLGLDLPSPIIVSSSPYTSNVKSVEQCAASGAGAVVLKSIFEEQILHHAAALDTVSDSAYGDAEVYLQRYLGEDYKAGFLRLVQEARSKTELPVIASINCVVDKGDWIEYATAMADAGASALELNIFIQSTDIHAQARELELNYAEIVGRVAGAVKIPVSVKLPMRLTNVFALSSALLGHGARGVVFFNRFFEPDVDVERMTFVESSPYSEPTELRNVLRGGDLFGRVAAVGPFCFDGRARWRGCGQSAFVRSRGSAGLHGDPPEGIRSHCRNERVHRPLVRAAGFRFAR